MRAISPELVESVQARRSRAHQLRWLKSEGTITKTQQYIDRYGLDVKDGPFKGMIYPAKVALERVSIPSLQGQYEKPLQSVIEMLACRRYDCVVDIGSAEGYYAVGLARKLHIPVYTFEPDYKERDACSMLAAANGVSEYIFQDRFFKADYIIRFSTMRVLLICDCEGFERHIFTAETVRATGRWDCVIELHGEAVSALPPLPWPQPRRCLIDSTDEYRKQNTPWLVCDSYLES